MKRLKITLCLSLMIFLLAGINSCDKDDEDCSGCTDSAKWSSSNSSNCYATQSDCESNEGTTCSICQ